MNAELTIVIPAKNEVKMLPKLLKSIYRQDYEEMAQTRVIIADAGSTDGTVEAALDFRNRLKVEVVPGGLPSVGRNAGARLATTRYVLFLDADVELSEPTLVRRALEAMRERELHLTTTNTQRFPARSSSGPSRSLPRRDDWQKTSSPLPQSRTR